MSPGSSDQDFLSGLCEELCEMPQKHLLKGTTTWSSIYPLVTPPHGSLVASWAFALLEFPTAHSWPLSGSHTLGSLQDAPGKEARDVQYVETGSIHWSYLKSLQKLVWTTHQEKIGGGAVLPKTCCALFTYITEAPESLLQCNGQCSFYKDSFVEQAMIPTAQL